MTYIKSDDRHIGRDEVQRNARRAASGFEAIGLTRGDAVAIYLRNDFAFFEASFAAALIGAYAVPVNWHYTPDEARYLLEDSGAKVLVIHADLLRRIANIIPKKISVLVVETPPEIRTAYGIAASEAAVPPDAIAWTGWLNSFEPLAFPTADSPGSMIYTSGTTGQPKGVRRHPPTPEQAAKFVQMLSRVSGFTPWLERPTSLVVAIAGPMYHTGPNTYALTAAQVGANVILQAKFDAEAFLALIERERITHAFLVPIMFNRLLRLPRQVREKYDISSLRFVLHAAAPVSVDVKKQMIEWWGPIIHEFYGSTETAMLAYCDSHDWLAHPGTVGKIIPEAEVKIIDAAGREVPSGQTGEIAAKLNGIADFTYHNDSDKRKRVDRNGLVAPGDVGYVDKDGFLYLCDRSTDMIISAGVNIYPAEIEMVLQSMPSIADSAVFGIPDPEFGEAVMAVIEPRPGVRITEEEVHTFLLPRIAGFKRPRRIIFQDNLPREDSGKIFKRKLREAYWLGLEKRIN
jgi:long-chain acyl-CoA synthetase